MTDEQIPTDEPISTGTSVQANTNVNPSSTGTTTAPGRWANDPLGRYELRWWDGTAWTAQVSRGGQQLLDPLGIAPSQASVPPTASPGWAPTPAGRPSRRRRGWLIPLVAIIAVMGVLIAGLVIWAPWSSSAPKTPEGVSAAATGSVTVVVRWSPASGGATIDQYVVLRDGVEVGSVAANRTSYRDEDLSPGTSYRYAVVAVSGSKRSDPSSGAGARTRAPSPVRLGVDSAGATTVAFHWSRPPDSPTPDRYVITRNDVRLGETAGTKTSYTDTKVAAGTSYRYRVAAWWGEHGSDSSSVLIVKTLTSEAPLQGSKQVRVTMTQTPGGTASGSVGQSWTDSWSFTPNCAASNCAVTARGSIAPPGYHTHRFTATLNRSGNGYTGAVNVHVTHCGTGTSATEVTNTLTFTIPSGTAGANGVWTSWSGSLVMSAPYTTTGGGRFCPAQSWTFALASPARSTA